MAAAAAESMKSLADALNLNAKSMEEQLAILQIFGDDARKEILQGRITEFRQKLADKIIKPPAHITRGALASLDKLDIPLEERNKLVQYVYGIHGLEYTLTIACDYSADIIEQMKQQFESSQRQQQHQPLKNGNKRKAKKKK